MLCWKRIPSDVVFMFIYKLLGDRWAALIVCYHSTRPYILSKFSSAQKNIPVHQQRVARQLNYTVNFINYEFQSFFILILRNIFLLTAYSSYGDTYNIILIKSKKQLKLWVIWVIWWQCNSEFFMVAVNSKHPSFVLWQGVKYFSYIAKIGYIEWNNENKSITYWNMTIFEQDIGFSVYWP